MYARHYSPALPRGAMIRSEELARSLFLPDRGTNLLDTCISCLASDRLRHGPFLPQLFVRAVVACSSLIGSRIASCLVAFRLFNP